MNIIAQFLQQPYDAEKAALLYNRYGTSQQIKADLQKGYAAYNMRGAIIEEFALLKSSSRIPEKETVQKAYVPPIPEKEPLQVVQKLEILLRNDNEHVKLINKQIENYLAERGSKANELTNQLMPPTTAASLIGDCKLITEEINRLQKQRANYIKTGVIQKAKKDETIIDVSSITDIIEINALLRQARSRRSKAKTNMANKPQSKSHFENKFKREELLIKQLLSQRGKL